MYTDGDVEDLSLQEIRTLVENYGKKMSRARTRDKKKVAKVVGNAGNIKSMEKIQEVVPPTKLAPRIRIKMSRKLKLITGAVKDGEGGALTDPRIDMTKNDGDSAELKRKRVEKPRQNSADEKADPELKLSFQELREDFIKKRKKTSPGLTSSSNAISNDVDASNQEIRRKVGRPVGPKKKITLPMHDLVGRQSEVRTRNAPTNKARGISVHSTLTDKSGQPQKSDEVRTLNKFTQDKKRLAAQTAATQHEQERLAAEGLSLKDEEERLAAEALALKQEEERLTAVALGKKQGEERLVAEARTEQQDQERLAAIALVEKQEQEHLAALAEQKEQNRLAAEALVKQHEQERLAAEVLTLVHEEERLAAKALALKYEAKRLVAEALAEQKEEERLAAVALAKKQEEERLAALAEQKEQERLAAVALAKRQEQEHLAALAEQKEQDRLAAEALVKQHKQERLAAKALPIEEEEGRLAAVALAEQQEEERLVAIALAKKQEEEHLAALTEQQDQERLAAIALAKKQGEEHLAALAKQKEQNLLAAEALVNQHEQERLAAEVLALVHEEERLVLALVREEERLAAKALALKHEAKRLVEEALAEQKEEERLAAVALAKKQEEERLAALAEQKEQERLAAVALAKRQEQEHLAALAEQKEQDRLAAEALVKQHKQERLAAKALPIEEEEGRLAAVALAEQQEEERLVAIALAKKQEEEHLAALAEQKEQERLAAEAPVKQHENKVVFSTQVMNDSDATMDHKRVMSVAETPRQVAALKLPHNGPERRHASEIYTNPSTGLVRPFTSGIIPSLFALEKKHDINHDSTVGKKSVSRASAAQSTSNPMEPTIRRSRRQRYVAEDADGGAKFGQVGYIFSKFFPGYGRFKGMVVEISPNWIRRCAYSDGDQEDLTLRELKHLSKLDEETSFAQPLPALPDEQVSGGKLLLEENEAADSDSVSNSSEELDFDMADDIIPLDDTAESTYHLEREASVNISKKAEQDNSDDEQSAWLTKVATLVNSKAAKATKMIKPILLGSETMGLKDNEEVSLSDGCDGSKLIMPFEIEKAVPLFRIHKEHRHGSKVVNIKDKKKIVGQVSCLD